MKFIKKREKVENVAVNKEKNIIPGVIFVALVAAIISYVVMLNIEKNALTAYEKTTVLVASTDIPKGELLTADNMNQYVSVIEMNKSLVSADMVTDITVLSNMMTVLEIKKGSIITGNLLDSLDARKASMAEPVVAGFNSEDLYQVVSGVLRAGDTINIYIVDEDEETASLGWKDIYVLQAFDTAGTEIGAEDSVTAAQRINVLMEQSAIEEFYSKLAQGSLRVVKIIED